ncbi:hemerythrin domain-containing protein [Hydrogenophaga sp. OTU3427]|uniref:hemerythrin domain-containing protein n=1 Tax=Hydrogenophaga sp. OTU3427 TaxID=3043856 RepID=UPI00313D16CB
MRFETLRIIRDEHTALSAMLQSLLSLMRQGPGDAPERFFDVLRAMLFYIDEFPEKQHHPKESDLLFPRVARVAPHTMEIIARLEREHMQGEGTVRELQHRLQAWELLGEGRRKAFVDEAERYVSFYLEHMRLEETVILPEAEAHLDEADRRELDAAFSGHVDPLVALHQGQSGQAPAHDPAFDRLFTRIVMRAPAPIGLG